MRTMEPVFHEPAPGGLDTRAFALCDFIFVMRKHQILTAQVKIESRSQQLHAHGAALDVPSRPALTPWAWPEDLSVLGDTRLPQGKISHGFLVVFVVADSFANAHRLEIEINELAIFVAGRAILLDAEKDRAIGR